MTLEELVSSPEFIFSGVGASFVALLWMVVAALKKLSSALKVVCDTQTLLSSYAINKYGLTLNVNGKAATQITRQIILIVNDTSRVIESREFIDAPSITTPSDLTLFSHELKSGGGLQSAKIEENGATIELTDFILDPQEGLILELIHDGKELMPSAKLKDQPRLIRIQKIQPWVDFLFIPAAVTSAFPAAKVLNYFMKDFEASYVICFLIMAFLLSTFEREIKHKLMGETKKRFTELLKQ